MIILAIDPGTECSAYVVFDTEVPAVHSFGYVENPYLLNLIKRIRLSDLDIPSDATIVTEGIDCMGQPIGKTTIATAEMIGAILVSAYGLAGLYHRSAVLPRNEIKLHLCGSTRGIHDSNIRQVLMERFPETGGGRRPVIGTKKKPGPLYGIHSHIWSALAVAVVFKEKQEIVPGGKFTIPKGTKIKLSEVTEP